MQCKKARGGREDTVHRRNSEASSGRVERCQERQSSGGLETQWVQKKKSLYISSKNLNKENLGRSLNGKDDSAPRETDKAKELCFSLFQLLKRTSVLFFMFMGSKTIFVFSIVKLQFGISCGDRKFFPKMLTSQIITLIYFTTTLLP